MRVDWNLAWALPYVGTVVIIALQLAKVRSERLLGSISVASIGASAVLTSAMVPAVLEHGIIHHYHEWVPELGVSLGVVIDGIGAFMANVVAWLSLFIAIYSVKYMEGDWGIGRYWIFFTFFVGSMLLLVLADNLVLMFIGWEGTGLASYALIGHWYTDERDAWVGDPGRRALGVPMFFTPSHSGLRALLFTRVGDLGFLIGIAGIYHLTGTFSIPLLAEEAGMLLVELARLGLLLPFLLMFSLGALAKSAQVPFHEWLVTAMTGPTPVSALIHAATMVKAGVYFMLRFAPIIYFGALAAGELSTSGITPTVAEQVETAIRDYFYLIAAVGCLTAFMLATMAVVSRELKLILAFSTASQLGYMFLGIGAAGLMKEFSQGYLASATHLMSHAVFKAALFLVAGAVIHAVHSRFIDDMGGLARYMKLSALSMWLAGLSLAGLPPFSGFWTKDAVIESSHEAGLATLTMLALVTAALTSVYTTRAVIRVFHAGHYAAMGRQRHHGATHHAVDASTARHVGEAHPLMLIPYVLLSIVALLLGVLWPKLAKAVSELVTGYTLALEEARMLHVAITKTAITSAILVFVALVAVMLLYMVVKVDFREVLARSRAARLLHDFLYDRWYANSLYYLTIVEGFKRLVRLCGDVIDAVVDKLYHVALPSAGNSLSTYVRRRHVGLIPVYVALMVAGTALILYWALLIAS